MTGAGRVRLPRLGRAARARLWLRYQRYGLLLVGVSPASVVAAAGLGPWWLVPVVALAVVVKKRTDAEIRRFVPNLSAVLVAHTNRASV